MCGMKPFQRNPEIGAEDETTGRCNFRLPIKTFNLMQEMARELGIESVSGAARHFCIKGIETSMSQYASLKAANASVSSVLQAQLSLAVQQKMISLLENEKEEKEKGSES